MAGWTRKATTAREKGDTDYTLAPEGTNNAAVVALIQTGLWLAEYDSGDREWVEKMCIVWELIDEPSPRPLLIKEYTLKTSNRAKLRPLVETILGKKYQDDEDIPIEKMLGKYCQVEVEHGVAKSGNSYAKLKSVVALPRKSPKLNDPEHKPVLFNCDEDDPNSLPSWLPYLYGRPLKDVVREGIRNGRINSPGFVKDGEPDEEEEPADDRPDEDKDIPF